MNIVDLNNTIGVEWDEICEIRAKEIENEEDKTYGKVLLPYILEVVKHNTKLTDIILDIGCGCSFLTSKISKMRDVHGIDISQKAIIYSRNKYPDILFFHGDACKIKLLQKYNFAVANMVVHNLPNYNDFFNNVYRMLNNDGLLLIILLHPRYWANDKLKNQGFIYNEQNMYLRNLKNCSKQIRYYHRPICDYISALEQCGLELWSIKPIYEEYDSIRYQKYPHILSILAKKGY